MTIEATLNDQDIKRLHRKLAAVNPRRREYVLTGAMRRVGLVLERDLKAAVSGPKSRRKQGAVRLGRLRVRSGRLRSSIGSRIFTGPAGDLAVKIGSGALSGKRVKYADIHETGGTIRPVNAKWLAIPLQAARTRGGDQRNISPRDFPNTFIRGRIIYQKRGPRSKPVPLFVLKRSVKIPARRYLSRTLEKARHRILADMVRSVEKGLSK